MSTSQQPAVFVDRDDTLIEDKHYLRDPEQIRILPGVPDALKRLRDAGFAVVIVTNQSGIARGYLTEDELQTVHEHLQERLAKKGAAVDAIYYCPYLDGREAVVEEYRRESDLRKPGPGMLLKAAADLRLDLAQSWMIGDEARDVQAGRAAGCRTILLGGGATDPEGKPDHTMSNFPAAADFILRESRRIAEMQNLLTAAKRDRSAGDGRRAQSQNGASNGGAVTGAAATATLTREERPRRVPPKSEPSASAASPVAPAKNVPAQTDRPPNATQAKDSSPVTLTIATPSVSNPSAPTAKSPDPAVKNPTDPIRPAPPQETPRPKADPPATETAAPQRDKPVSSESAAAAGQSSPPSRATAPRRRSPDDPLAVMDEILEELRAIRRQRQFVDFSFLQLAGAIAQAFALCALIFGLYSIANGQSERADLSLLAGIAFQLMALTGFVASRRR